MPTLTPVCSPISQQKASSRTPGLCPHLAFTHSVLVPVHRIHLPRLIHPPPPLRPHIPPLLPRPLVPLTLVLVDHLIAHRPLIPHNVSGPPSMTRATIVVNGVTNNVTAMPLLEVLAL